MKDREETVFNALFDRYFKKIYSFTYKLLGDQETAKELALDVMMRLWQNRFGLVLEENQTLLPYLFQSARNAIANHLRKSRILTSSLDWNDELNLPAASASDEGVHLKELEREYRRVLAQMPEQRRKIFLLSREENLAYAEIAAQLNLSVHTVRNQVSAALDFLKKNFHPDHQKITVLFSLTSLSALTSF